MVKIFGLVALLLTACGGDDDDADAGGGGYSLRFLFEGDDLGIHEQGFGRVTYTAGPSGSTVMGACSNPPAVTDRCEPDHLPFGELHLVASAAPGSYFAYYLAGAPAPENDSPDIAYDVSSSDTILVDTVFLLADRVDDAGTDARQTFEDGSSSPQGGIRVTYSLNGAAPTSADCGMYGRYITVAAAQGLNSYRGTAECPTASIAIDRATPGTWDLTASLDDGMRGPLGVVMMPGVVVDDDGIDVAIDFAFEP